MSDNWLQTRLSPVKKDTVRWQELAQAIETFWQENFDADSARLDGLKSIFTATRADQLAILSELGKYYDIDLPDDSIPLAVIQRRMELFQKDTLVPLTESLKRACPGISTEWQPIYALDKWAYEKSLLFTQAELTARGWWPVLTTPVLDGSWSVKYPTLIHLVGANLFYLTSRGKLFIDETGLISEPNAVEATIRSRIAMVKPAHIVLDGIIWGYSFDLDYTLSGLVSLIHTVNASFDISTFSPCGLTVDGSWVLDGESFLCSEGGHLFPVRSDPTFSMVIST